MSKVLIWLAFFTLAASAARAQAPGPDPIAEHLFPLELVMRHAADIGLEDRQRTTVKETIQKVQPRLLDLQWEMQAEAERMVRLLQARPVDEPAVLAQADRVLNLEREIKKTHLSLLVRVKNLLTEPQQQKLLALRRRAPSN